MSKYPNVSALIELLSDEEKMPVIKDLLLEREKYLKQIEDAQAKVEEVEKIIASKLAVHLPKDAKSGKSKGYHPKEGSKPYALTIVMGPEPKPIEEIMKALGRKGVYISIATLRSYLGTFGCFKNVRGKGYYYDKEG